MPVTTGRISQVQLVVLPVSDQERAVALLREAGLRAAQRYSMGRRVPVG